MTLLEEMRQVINETDTELVKLFERRMHAVEGVIRYKMENGLPILDSGREAENIARTSALVKDERLKAYFTDWYTYTMKVSKDYQKEIREKEGK